MSKIPGPSKRKRKNGHWIVHVILGVLVIGLWAIPFDTLESEVSEMGAKIGLLSTVARAVVDDLTITVRSLSTLLGVSLALGYVWYSRRKAQ